MRKYIDADRLEKDGWSIVRIRQASPTEMVYETKKPTDFPAADVVEVRHGRWIDDETAYICSVCFHGSPSGAKWNYCPNCGAKMDGEQNE